MLQPCNGTIPQYCGMNTYVSIHAFGGTSCAPMWFKKNQWLFHPDSQFFLYDQTVLHREHKIFPGRLRNFLWYYKCNKRLMNYFFELGKFGRLADKILCPVYEKQVYHFLFKGSGENDNRKTL